MWKKENLRRRRLYTTKKKAGSQSARSQSTLRNGERLEQRIVLNAAPVLDDTASPALLSIAEDAGAPVGQVGTFVSSLIDTSGTHNNFSDTDGDLPGIAITGVNLQGGVLWYSSDDGSTWLDVGAVSDEAPRLLAADATSRIYFEPAADFSGTVSDVISFKAWDRNVIWQQLGLDIDGAANDQSGYSVSLSADGQIVAIGAKYAGNQQEGRVDIYSWDGSTWSQLGGPIEGEFRLGLGKSVSLSADGQTVAIGGEWGSSGHRGKVRVYSWTDTTWAQVGEDIDGEQGNSYSGSSVSLSADGQTVAIGAPIHNGENNIPGKSRAGQVRIYSWAGSTWNQLGAAINGELADEEQFGYSISLSATGSVVVIGAPYNDANGTGSGAVRVYEWTESTWNQLGSQINGQYSNEYFGKSVSMSADGQTLAIGGPGNNNNLVRVYELTGSIWNQIGTDIVNAVPYNSHGNSFISLSEDGQRVAIGSPSHSQFSQDSSQTRIYSWNDSEWEQLGAELYGESEDDLSGYSVSLSVDGQIVAIGAKWNDGNGINSGHVRVYQIAPDPSAVSTVTDTISVDVTYVNDAPVVSVPGAVTTGVDQPVGFVASRGDGISISDIDAGSNPVEVTLSADKGTVSLVHPNPGDALTYSVGDGAADTTMTFRGTVADINTALGWVSYQPATFTERYFFWSSESGGNDHWYEFVSTSRSWDAAKSDAESRGGYLAVMATAGATDFIASQGITGNAWVGGYQDRTGFTFEEPLDGWRWNNGETWVGDKWLENEPNDGGGTEHHLGLNLETGKFFDADGTLAVPGRSYLVEYTSDPRPEGWGNLDATLSITTDDLGNVGTGGSLTDTDTITIEVAPASFASSPSYATLPSTLDSSLDGDGIQVVSLTSGVDYISDMQVLSDGKVVAVGAVNDNFGVMRFNADMTLDSTFGDAGGTRVDFGSGVHARAMAIDDTGRIIAVGGNRVVRFTADGALDTSFSADGWATDDNVVQCHGVTLEANGNILVTGRENEHFRLSRWSPDGVRTKTYDRDVDPPGQYQYHNKDMDYSRSVLSQEDGDILILGVSGGRDGSNNVLRTHTVVRLNQEMVFEAEYKYDLGVGDDEFVHASLALPDGTFLLIGDADDELAVSRYLATGAKDSSFGTDGVVKLAVQNDADTGFRATLAADGKILITGYSDNSENNDLTVIRLNYDGSVDDTFGTNGSVSFDISGEDYGYGIASLADGKILVGGRAGDDIALVRLLGDSDQSAAPANQAPVNSVPGSQVANTGASLAFSAPRGNLISISDADAANNAVEVTLSVDEGTITIVNPDPLGRIAYLSGDGFEDASVTFTGSVADVNKAMEWISYRSAADYSGTATLSITTDDLGNVGTGGSLTDTDTITIEVAPASFASSPSYATLPSTLDSSLDGDGIQVVSLTSGVDYISDMQVLSDGKVVAVGAVNDNFGVMRFNADMTLDSTFGDAGGTRVDFGSGVHARAMAIDDTGRIIAVGGNRVVRFTADGALDTSFSADGWATDDNVVQCHGVTLEANGNILVTGRENEHFRLSRWSPDGVRTKTYDRDVDPPGQYQYHNKDMDYSRSVLSQEDGDILILGVSGGRDGSNNVLRTHTVVRLNQEMVFEAEYKYDLGVGDDEFVHASLALPDGTFLLIGDADDELAVSRYLATGAKDSSFGTDGVVKLAVQNDADTGFRATLAADGKILITGYSDNSENNDLTVIRLNYDGSVDDTFGTNGSVSFDISGEDYGYGIASLADGKILVGGRAGDDIALVRLLGDSDYINNSPPTFAAIGNQTAERDSGVNDVSLTGISAGGEIQVLRVSATSSNESLIANPSIIYQSPDSTGTLQYTPEAGQVGTSTITVTVEDAGHDGDFAAIEDNGTYSLTFDITVNHPPNEMPTLDAISDVSLQEDAAPSLITLSGLSAGIGETEPFEVTATTSAAAIAQPSALRYDLFSDTWSFDVIPTSNAFGDATISVTVTDPGVDGDLNTVADNQSITRSFEVSIAPVNDLPILPVFNHLSIFEDSMPLTQSFAGVSAGGGETQPLSITAVSDNTSLIPDPTVSYSSPDATGALTFHPVANQSGSAEITVTLEDGGLDNDLGTPDDNGVINRTVIVAVAPVNDMPTLDELSDINIDEDDPEHTINLTGVSAGAGETQVLSVTAVSDNTGLIPDPTVVFDGQSSTGTLTFTPVADQSGTATITVTVEDGGIDNDLGTPEDNGIINRTIVVRAEAVNDAPDVTSPVNTTINEDSDVQVNGFTIFDRDIDTSLGFGHSIVGTIQDKNGIGTGFTHRLPGTGSALAEQDSNIDIDLMTGKMLLTSTRSDIQHDLNLPTLENPALLLEDIGTDDFTVTVVVRDVHVPNLSDQFGIIVGSSVTETVRAGIHDSDVFWFSRNAGGSDNNWFSGANSFMPGDDLRIELSRTNQKWKMRWTNLTDPARNGSSSEFDIPWLDDENDLYVGLHVANARSDHSFVTRIDEFHVETQSPEILTANLSTLNGAVSLGETDGLNFISGDGSFDASMVFSGPLSRLNAALETVTYRGNQDFHGVDTVSLTINDEGQYGSGGPLATMGAFDVTVTPVNDAPVLDAAASPQLASVLEDAGAPSGQVGSLVSDLIDAGGTHNNFSDVDGDLPGIAITGVNLQGGSLWYSTDNGATWVDVGAVSDAVPKLLAADATTRLYFQPAADFSGTISDVLSFKAWDNGFIWQQIGLGIEGETFGDYSGKSLSLSTDGETVAIGSYLNDGNGTDSGHVRIFRWSGSEWIQLGDDLDGEAADDWSGFAISIAADGETIAVGGYLNDGNGTDSGHVRIYRWSGAEWIQLGDDLDGEAANDWSGFAVSIAADGETIAVGARHNDGNGSNSGHARIYRWSGAEWIQLGADLDGEYANDSSGYSVSLSADGETIAVGARYNDENGTNSGHVRIYRWSGAEWIQLGGDLDGQQALEHFGYSISLAADGGTVAIGAYGNDQNGPEAGTVRVFHWTGTAWNQQGSDINGINSGDSSGNVSLSADGEIVLIGADRNDGNGFESGHVRIFNWTGADWIQVGADIYGDSPGDRSGWWPAISPSGNVVAIDGTRRDANGTDSGHVRIFKFVPSVSTVTDTISVTVEPQNDAPTGDVTIDGIATQSAVLSANTSTVQDEDGLGAFAYEWLRDGVPISAATSSTYTLTQDDVNAQVSVRVDYTDNEGTAESLTSAQTSAVVNVNDAPVLDAAASPQLASVLEDAGAPSGQVGSLVSDLIDAGGTHNNFSDVDGDLPGIAITGINLQGGSLWYSTDDGATWVDVGAVSDAVPRLLAADTTTRLYFQPAADFSGSISDVISFKAWDRIIAGWEQLGLDIDGEEISDNFGHAVAISADGQTVAVGAPKNGGSSQGSRIGHVRIYSWTGSTWRQRGEDINGEAQYDESGWAVSLSADGQRVAIGAYENGPSAGHVRIYSWDGSAWNQLGADIDGEASGDRSGYFVSLSADGQTVAIGARDNDGNGNNSGHVRIYSWTESNWIQRGLDIDGELEGDWSGYSVSLSSDGQTVAIGAPRNGSSFGQFSRSGHVRIYSWTDSAWVQLGDDIDAEATGDQSGYSVSLSSDGQTVAVGAAYSDANGSNSGCVRIYSWTGASWSKLGADIDGESNGDAAGGSVALSGDGHTVAIGAYHNDGNGHLSGHVRIYSWTGSSWSKLQGDIDGEAAGDNSGWAVSLSADGQTVAIGAPKNDGNGDYAGHVRVYHLATSFSALTDTISVTVGPVDDEPTLDALSDVTINEDDLEQTVNLTGIAAGGGETQVLSVSATSDNTGLIPDPTIDFDGQSSTGTLMFTPVADQFGTATITVTVEDGGLDNDLATPEDNGVINRTVTVITEAVNDEPTLDVLSDVNITEDALEYTVNLTGITAGGSEPQVLSVTAVSDNTGLIPDPTVNFDGQSSAGILKFTPVADQSGTAMITVTVEDGGLDNDLATPEDNGIINRTIVVRAEAVNDAPTLDALSDVNITEDDREQTVNLTGITAAGGETQLLSVTAVSDNTGLIPDPTVDFDGQSSTGTLKFTPVADQSGTATITVTVTDGGLDNDLATPEDNGVINRTVIVKTEPVNDAPTLDLLSDRVLPEDSQTQIIDITGITAGVGETQPLQVTVTSSNPSLISDPTLTSDAVSAEGSRSLAFVPLPDQYGITTITVTVEDGGLDLDLSTAEDNAIFSRTFDVTVTPDTDDQPSQVTPHGRMFIHETLSGDSLVSYQLPAVNVNGEAINGLPNRMTVTSSDTALIPDPTVLYAAADVPSSLSFTPVASANGTATLSIQVEDGGPDNDFATTEDNRQATHQVVVNVLEVISNRGSAILAKDNTENLYVNTRPVVYHDQQQAQSNIAGFAAIGATSEGGENALLVERASVTNRLVTDDAWRINGLFHSLQNESSPVLDLTAREVSSTLNIVAVAGAYEINGARNPTLVVRRGQIYNFNLNVANHPFFLQTTGNGYRPENGYNNFFQGQGRTEGEHMWLVPADAPDELYYQCEFHPVMFGKIIVVD